MKRMFALLLVSGCLLAPAYADTVVLTRNDAASAADIDAAIDTATRNGTVAGTVVLDGSAGRFTFPDFSDQTIDIDVSNITLAGINGAAVDAAITFGGIEVENILIKNLEIRSPFEDGSAIVSIGTAPTRNVTLRNNVISSEGSAIFITNATDWTICNNRITSGAEEGVASVTLLGAQGSQITGNTITSGGWGILLAASQFRESTGNKVVANRVSAFGRGIVLGSASSRNAVLLNHISLAPSSDPVIGIFLDTGTSLNKVLWNKASTTGSGGLVTVQDLGNSNRVSGNTP